MKKIPRGRKPNFNNRGPGALLLLFLMIGFSVAYLFWYNSISKDREHIAFSTFLTHVENNGVKLLIDPMSFQYLAGAEIDYTEGLEGAQFVIRNPNATTTCGCGSSFSV